MQYFTYLFIGRNNTRLINPLIINPVIEEIT